MRGKILAKQIISYTAILVALFTVLEVALFGVGYRSQLAEAVSRNEEMAVTMGSGFDSSIAAFRKQVTYVTMSPDLQAGLEALSASGEVTTEQKNRLRSAIVSNVQTMNEITGIYLYDNTGSRITYWQKSPWNNVLAARYLTMPDTAFAEDGSIRLDTWNGDVIFTRRVLSYQTQSFLKPLGYIVFFYDLHEFEALLGNIAPDEKRLVALVSPEGELITASPTSSKALKDFAARESAAYTALKQTQMVRAESGRVLVCNYRSAQEGWTITHLMEESELTEPLRRTGLLVLLVSLAGMILGLFAVIQNARRTTRPILELRSQVEGIEKGDYTVRNAVTTGDEMEALGHAINGMAERIDQLINRQLADELRFKDMRLMALQAQINPHFLYNTLECVNSLAELGRKEDVRRVTVAFSELMKALTQENRLVTISREFAYTEDFLTIYGIMLGERLSWRIACDPELESMEIPRLSIQPLVENAVLHGIKPCAHACEVVVSASFAEDGVLLSVTDDGVGIEPEEAERLTRQLSGGEGEEAVRNSIGLPNVYGRLRLLYGERVRLTVTGYPGLGTTIDILIPNEMLPASLQGEE